MIDAQDIKRQANIIDVINGYLPLKKQGKEFVACCPFHDERTPSFTVNEQKQFYHCFGCGANGDVIKFLTEYNGWDFRQAAKALGADIESQPLEKVRVNERRKLTWFKLPPDHEQDSETAQKMLASSSELLPVSTVDGEVVNVYSKKLDQCMLGNSYNAAYWIIANNKRSAAVTTSYYLGNTIARVYGINVAVCFTGAILKYLCKWNNGDWKLKPVITAQTDDYLCYEMPYLFWDGEKLEKKDIKP